MLQAYVFKCFIGMLQVLHHMDVAKVDWDVAYVVSVSNECCKHLSKMFHLFQTYVASVLIWMLHIFMFQMFHLFLSYVVVSVFMLQVVSVLLYVAYVALSMHVLQVYVPNFSAVLDVCCKCFVCMLHMLQWLYTYVASLYSKYFACFKCILQQMLHVASVFSSKRGKRA